MELQKPRPIRSRKMEEPPADADLTNMDDRRAVINDIDCGATLMEVSRMFSLFGNIECITVFPKCYQNTNLRYGQVVFCTRNSMLTACAASIWIRGRKISVTPFRRRLLVTGLYRLITVNMLEDFFSQYGPILQIEFVIDNVTNVRERFFFLTFTTCSAAQLCLRDPIKLINGQYFNVVGYNIDWNDIDLSGKKIYLITYDHI